MVSWECCAERVHGLGGVRSQYRLFEPAMEKVKGGWKDVGEERKKKRKGKKKIKYSFFFFFLKTLLNHRFGDSARVADRPKTTWIKDITKQSLFVFLFFSPSSLDRKDPRKIGRIKARTSKNRGARFPQGPRHPESTPYLTFGVFRSGSGVKINQSAVSLLRFFPFFIPFFFFLLLVFSS